MRSTGSWLLLRGSRGYQGAIIIDVCEVDESVRIRDDDDGRSNRWGGCRGSRKGLEVSGMRYRLQVYPTLQRRISSHFAIPPGSASALRLRQTEPARRFLACSANPVKIQSQGAAAKFLT